MWARRLKLETTSLKLGWVQITISHRTIFILIMSSAYPLHIRLALSSYHPHSPHIILIQSPNCPHFFLINSRWDLTTLTRTMCQWRLTTSGFHLFSSSKPWCSTCRTYYTWWQKGKRLISSSTCACEPNQINPKVAVWPTQNLPLEIWIDQVWIFKWPNLPEQKSL